MTLATLSPDDTRAAIDAGARLIDIRGADEHARERIPGAMNVPLDRIGDLPRDDRPVVFHCKSGMRTAANAAQLGALWEFLQRCTLREHEVLGIEAVGADRAVAFEGAVDLVP